MDFRDFVDNRIRRKRDEILIKLAYLTAARVSEITTKVTPWDEQHKRTQPYGLWMKTNLPDMEDFTHTVFRNGEPRLRTEKVLTITMACAKRKRKGSKKDPDRKVYKVIALPTTQAYEPWTIDLLKWWNVTRKFSFDMTGARLWQIVRENLGDLDPQIHPHSLRHYRVNHLVYEYGIDPHIELPFITGWTFGNPFGQGRSSAAEMLNIYLHGAWQKYFPKLLKPMSYHAIRPLELEKEPQVDPALMKALQEASTKREPTPDLFALERERAKEPDDEDYH